MKKILISACFLVLFLFSFYVFTTAEESADEHDLIFSSDDARSLNVSYNDDSNLIFSSDYVEAVFNRLPQHAPEPHNILFTSHNSQHRFIFYDDGTILHSEEIIGATDHYVTKIQWMTKYNAANTLFPEQETDGIVEALIDDSVKGGSVPFLHSIANWNYESHFSTQYEIITLKYTGQLPEDAVTDDYSFLDNSPYFPPAEEWGKNPLTLSAFLSTYLPGYTQEQFALCRYVIPHAIHMEDPDYALHQTGSQMEKYIIHQEDSSIYVDLYRQADVEDPLILEIEFQLNPSGQNQEEQLADYLNLFLLLPGMEDDLFLPLRYLLGDEVTWTQIIRQRPYAKQNEWKLSFRNNKPGIPVAVFSYVGTEY